VIIIDKGEDTDFKVVSQMFHDMGAIEVKEMQ